MIKKPKRKILIQDLIPVEPDPIYNFCGCGSHIFHKQTATEIELNLAAKKHRWPEMNNAMKEMFLGIAAEVIEAEEDGLKLFNLPGIDEIESDAKTSNIKPKITETTLKHYDDVIRELQYDILGNKALKKIKANDDESDIELPIFQYYFLMSYGLGISRTTKLIKAAMEKEGMASDPINVIPNQNDEIYKSLVAKGGDRIKTKLARDNLGKVKEFLPQMMLDGQNPLTIARALHREFKGNLWYWNRIARSELVLANNLAFYKASLENGILYEEWSTAANACPICSGYSGFVWKLGEGPLPVSDTHPHCLCIRIPRYTLGNNDLQPKWDEPSPYKNELYLEHRKVIDYLFRKAA